MADILRVDPERPDAAAIDRATAILRAGGLVAFPTETVYGLGGHALDRLAVLRIFAAKGRPASDPLIVHVRDVEQAASVTAELPEAAHRLAARFWPGPLTIVVRRRREVPHEVTAGLDSVAVRVPAHPVARALLDAAALPIAAPSANLFSRPSPTLASHVADDLGDRIDLILDAGPTTVGIESTVVSVASKRPTLLRPGAISLDALRDVLPDLVVRPRPESVDAALPSPGLLATHYAPRTPLTLYEGPGGMTRLMTDARASAADRLGVLAPSEDVEGMAYAAPGAVVFDLGPRGDDARAASRLFAGLRELDGAGLDRILARGHDGGGGLWPAIQDRLRRAAARVVTA